MVQRSRPRGSSSGAALATPATKTFTTGSWTASDDYYSLTMSAGQAGADGGDYGGGGGGGGGGYGSQNGGNGGLGGKAYVRITCWLKRDLPTRRSTLDSFCLAF